VLPKPAWRRAFRPALARHEAWRLRGADHACGTTGACQSLVAQAWIGPAVKSTTLPRRGEGRQFPATTAKNEFGRIVDIAIQGEHVIITKHERPHAVVLAYEQYAQLLSRVEPDLKQLTRDFDQMLLRMQTARARAAARDLFAMGPAELGQAAVAHAAKK
jgi:antitoxin Phd